MKTLNTEIKEPNLRLLLHPGSLIQVQTWLKKENAELSNENLDAIALESIISSHNSNNNPDYEVALKVFNSKLKAHINKSK